MITNPKNVPSLSDREQLYFLYILNQVELIADAALTFDVFVDIIYNLGQTKQEMYEDDDLVPSHWVWLNDFIDSVILSLKKQGGCL